MTLSSSAVIAGVSAPPLPFLKSSTATFATSDNDNDVRDMRRRIPGRSRLAVLWDVGSRDRLWRFVVLAVAPALGCLVPSPAHPSGAGRNAGIPSWAKHVKTAAVSDRETLQQEAGTIEGELGREQLVDFHMPAEQMAFAAMQSLEGGHRADAALLLSIASYRYRQEAQHVLEVGFEPPPQRLAQTNNSAYFKLVRVEEQTYAHLEFGDQLRVLAAWLRGEDALEMDADFVRRLGELFKEPSVDEETLREAMRERLPTGDDAGTETPEGGALAEAFLARLRADAGDKRKAGLGAVWAMARTPLPAFQLEALRFAWLPVAPRFCSHIADQLGAHRAAVVEMLADAKDATRAAAAVVLGMSPSDDQIPALERRWEAERQPLVRLTVAYALARHGRRAHVRDLVAALDNCKGDTCLQAIALLDWLPRNLLVEVSEDVPTAVASDGGKDWLVRMFGASLLDRMALEHPLGARSRAALFAASHDRHEQMWHVALEAIGRDSGFPRSEVVGRLAGAAPDYRPLLARLAHVATAADLPLAAKLMPRFAPGAVPSPEATSLVEAVGAVPGPAAESLLVTWFDAYPALHPAITLRLLQRRPSSERALDHVAAAGDGRARLLVALVRRPSDALGALDLALRASDPNERLFAARLAGTVGDPRSSGELWRLVNFSDDRYYPEDALMRHEAMAALLRIALATHRPRPRPRGTMAAAEASGRIGYNEP